jgi:hypothetical protein
VVVALLTGSNGPNTGLNYRPEGRKIHCGLHFDSRDFQKIGTIPVHKEKRRFTDKMLGDSSRSGALRHWSRNILYTTVL